MGPHKIFVPRAPQSLNPALDRPLAAAVAATRSHLAINVASFKGASLLALEERWHRNIAKYGNVDKIIHYIHSSLYYTNPVSSY